MKRPLSPAPAPAGRQWLLVDADDTLWENNIYFERAIDRFIEYVNHTHLTHAEVRATLYEIERANAERHGYGCASFGRNLQEAFCRLAQRPVTEESLQEVAGFAEAILEHPLEIIGDVPETLAYLAPRHHLVLLTKGDPVEQRSKIERSGLAHFFAEMRVVHEKNAGAFREVLRELGASAEQSWMVGNSPRSDINPALAVGMNAVWVPHDATWVLEHEEIAGGAGKLLVLSHFAELRDYF